MDWMEEQTLLEEALREARNGPIAPEHDTDDQTSWGGGVEYSHDGRHGCECHCVECMMQLGCRLGIRNSAFPSAQCTRKKER